ncbi:MAG TPA: histidine--tRNA ligase [Clostridiales bacterium]|nr:MAG: histidine--tRNA ligase [Clostridiales bacterium GWD2_32_19]HCC08168.1 histidine--tRNA ligase [Clostridiales bacterium]
MEIQLPRGTKDWFGNDIEVRRYIENIERELCRLFNIKEIDTPVFEYTELFERGVGDTTDIVQKEMYTFMDKGDRSITLKPEGTAVAVRAFIQNNMYANIQPTKMFYIMPMFRYEKPQSGRLRQHHQFGVEYFGSTLPTADVEVITLLIKLFSKLKLPDVKLHINSIGCKSCRREYNEKFIKYLEENKEHLCDTCRERMYKNPMRVIDCKNKQCKDIANGAPRILDYLDDECKEHFEKLKRLLEVQNIPYEIDKDIVRGQDYYTKTVFEFIDRRGSTICGGGRYDNLVEEIGGKSIPAVGFGVGVERLILALTEENTLPTIENDIDIFIGYIGDKACEEVQILASHLRDNNITVEVEHLNRSVKAQMKYADKIGAKHVVIVGDTEIETGIVKLKNMNTGEEKEITLDKILQTIYN